MFETLVELERGGLIESVHAGSMVLLNADGSVQFEVGDIDATMYPRSTSKLFQAAGMLELGLDVDERELALVAASHSGGETHVEIVRGILQRYGLDESHLKCIVGMPLGRPERLAYQAQGGVAAAIRTDCSGKHAGFLATCVAQGLDVDTYLDESHPLQQHLKDAVADAVDDELAITTIDGCGAPLFSMSLHALARGYRKALLSDPATELGRVARAMKTYPELVGGEGREATLAAQAGTLAKDGAEAVFAIAHEDGRACAIKIGDGSKRALAPVVNAVLISWGLEPNLPVMPVLGGGVVRGELRIAAAVSSAI